MLSNNILTALQNTEMHPDDYNLIIKELINLICPNNYKHGSYRYTFFPYYDPSIVIKIEYTKYASQNITETQTYNYISQNEPTKTKFFAPILAISENNKILIQKRIQPLTHQDLYNNQLMPTHVPASFLLDDPHINNFGLHNNQLTCLDYGFPESLIYAKYPLIPFETFLNTINNNISRSKRKEICHQLHQHSKSLSHSTTHTT